MKELERLLNYKKNVVFLDFEGTQFSQEIFAIGAVKATLDNKYNIKEHSTPFKGIIIPTSEIGSKIEEITGFDEVFVKNNGKNFYDVINSFKKYCGPNYDQLVFITYGNFDKRLLRNTQVLYKLEKDGFMNAMLKNLLDISSFFSRFLKDENNQQYSLKESLEIFNVTFEGREHDPSADAYNLMLLYGAFLKHKKVVMENYKRVLDRKSSLPRPILMTLKQLNEKGSVTIDDYINYIYEDLK